ncbi:MAG: hypothetical protein GY710_05810 [Desulfobacteraceae bacterium]|nr:hypothetical protein [Desulfobacteraceae bacterium]
MQQAIEIIMKIKSTRAWRNDLPKCGIDWAVLAGRVSMYKISGTSVDPLFIHTVRTLLPEVNDLPGQLRAFSAMEKIFSKNPRVLRTPQVSYESIVGIWIDERLKALCRRADLIGKKKKKGDKYRLELENCTSAKFFRAKVNQIRNKAIEAVRKSAEKLIDFDPGKSGSNSTGFGVMIKKLRTLLDERYSSDLFQYNSGKGNLYGLLKIFSVRCLRSSSVSLANTGVKIFTKAGLRMIQDLNFTQNTRILERVVCVFDGKFEDWIYFEFRAKLEGLIRSPKLHRGIEGTYRTWCSRLSQLLKTKDVLILNGEVHKYATRPVKPKFSTSQYLSSLVDYNVSRRAAVLFDRTASFAKKKKLDFFVEGLLSDAVVYDYGDDTQTGETLPCIKGLEEPDSLFAAGITRDIIFNSIKKKNGVLPGNIVPSTTTSYPLGINLLKRNTNDAKHVDSSHSKTHVKRTLDDKYFLQLAKKVPKTTGKLTGFDYHMKCIHDSILLYYVAQKKGTFPQEKLAWLISQQKDKLMQNNILGYRNLVWQQKLSQAVQLNISSSGSSTMVGQIGNSHITKSKVFPDFAEQMHSSANDILVLLLPYGKKCITEFGMARLELLNLRVEGVRGGKEHIRSQDVADMLVSKWEAAHGKPLGVDIHVAVKDYYCLEVPQFLSSSLVSMLSGDLM